MAAVLAVASVVAPSQIAAVSMGQVTAVRLT
jgi:hypothetical protein